MTRPAALAVLLLAVTLAVTAPARGQAAVQRVDLQVVIEGPAPHPVIIERLTATVQSVAERLLVGRSPDQLTALGPQLGETIATVVDRVATGYAVTAASVRLGTAASVAEVAVRLRPLDPVIRAVEVAADLRSLHPRLHGLAADLLARGPGPAIRALYQGLPHAALDWADPILQARAREAVEGGLLGFTAVLRPHLRGEGAVVEVALVPRDTRIVRNIGVRFRSSSIPTMLLDQHAPAVASMAEPLRALPVAFAQAHQATLAQLIRSELERYPPARQYRIIATAALDVGETTYVTVVADSVLYRARVEAELNIGTQAPGPAVVGHLGYLLAPQAEAFVEVRLVPSLLSLEWRLGAQLALSPTIMVGAAYAPAAGETTVWTAMRLGLDTGVRATWNLSAQFVEGALTYRFNEFLSGELVGTSRGVWWLRLISNL